MAPAGASTLLEPATWLCMLWLTLRLLPLVMIVPFLRVSRGPLWLSGLLGAGLLLALGLASWPLPLDAQLASVLADAHASWPALSHCVWAAACELLRGTLFALGVALPLYAVSWGGRSSDALRHAQLVPGEDSPLETLFHAAAIALFFSSGTHLLVLERLADGLRSQPLGSTAAFSSVHAALAQSAGLFVDALGLAITLAAPVLLCVLVAALAVGLVARTHATLAQSLADSGLLPWLGLAVVFLAAGQLLSDTPLLVRVFMTETERLLAPLR